MKNGFFFIALLSFISSSCKKEEKIEISTTPEITFVSITPSNVKEYQEQITITISYKDGDGDLGENTPDVKNLFVTDSRNNVTYKYRISQLAPSGDPVAIQGGIPIILKNTALSTGSSSESVSFSIYVKDRAGNQSNTITSSAITVSK